MIALLLTFALAQEPDPFPEPVVPVEEVVAPTLAQMTSVSMGFEWVANDPFVHQRGLRTAVTLDALPWFGSYISGGISPNFGQADWTAITRELVDNGNLAPNLSRITGHAMLMSRWKPIHTQGKTQSSLGLATGMGLVHTVDDLAIIQVEDRPIFQKHAKQLHLAFAWSIDAEVRKENLGFRVRCDLMSYRERVGPFVDAKRPMWFGAEAVLWAR